MNAHPLSSLEAVLMYADEGYYPFPWFPKKKSDGTFGKIPSVKGWELNEPPTAPPNKELLREWFGPGGKFQDHNVGLATGWKWNYSENKPELFAVVDTDVSNGKKGKESWEKLLEDIGLTKEDARTRTQRTQSGGEHRFYRVRNKLKNKAKANAKYPDIDIRCCGGYVAVWPSKMNGKSYEWIDPIEPAWMHERMEAVFPHAGASRSKPARAAGPIEDSERAYKRAKRWLLTGAPLAIEGDGGEQLTYNVACRLRDFGCSQAQALDLMLKYWADRCSPPWNADDLSVKVSNAYAYAQEQPGSGAPEIVFSPVEDPLTGAEHWTADQIREHAADLLLLARHDADRLARLRDGWDMFDVTAPGELDRIMENVAIALAGVDEPAITSDQALLKKPDVQRALSMLRERYEDAFRALAERLAAADIRKMVLRRAADAGAELRRVEAVKNARRVDGRTVVAFRPGNLVAVVDEIEAAMLADVMSEPMFAFAGGYATIRKTRPATVRELNGDGEYPPMSLVYQYDVPSMAERIGKSVRLEATDTKGRIKPASVSDAVVRMLLSRNGGNAPALTGIIESPTVRFDGSLLDQEGYDLRTGLFAVFNGTEFRSVPAAPTREQAGEALRFLETEMLAEFPFAEKLDQTVAVSALLTGLVRPMIYGSAPGYCISAPEQGTGKTALASVITHGAYGRPPAARQWPSSDDEMSKALLAVLREGQRSIVFDNLRDGQTVDSAPLAAAMTSDSYSARVLGTNESATVPTAVLWLVTGNNITPAGDMPTRLLVTYLDALEEQPDRRSFDRDLVQWMTRNRPRVVQAALTIIRAYFAAGCPATDGKATRFPGWDRLVRLPLIHAGGLDIGAKFDRAHAEDPALSVWRQVLDNWHKYLGAEAVTATGLLERLEKGFDDKANTLSCALRELVEDRRGVKMTAKTLGHRLKKYANRPVGGLKLSNMFDKHLEINLWSLRETI
jgi:hypothetical protein